LVGKRLNLSLIGRLIVVSYWRSIFLFRIHMSFLSNLREAVSDLPLEQSRPSQRRATGHYSTFLIGEPETADYGLPIKSMRCTNSRNRMTIPEERRRKPLPMPYRTKVRSQVV
jgi:hypothetical protein